MKSIEQYTVSLSKCNEMLHFSFPQHQERNTIISIIQNPGLPVTDISL